MLALPTKSLRVKAAVAMAVIYGFCVLLPAFAFALADGRMVPPCLMEELAAVSVHDHDAMQDGAAADASHQHHDAGGHHHHAVAADEHAGMYHHGVDRVQRQPPIPTTAKAAPASAAACFP